MEDTSAVFITMPFTDGFDTLSHPSKLNDSMTEKFNQTIKLFFGGLKEKLETRKIISITKPEMETENFMSGIVNGLGEYQVYDLVLTDQMDKKDEMLSYFVWTYYEKLKLYAQISFEYHNGIQYLNLLIPKKTLKDNY